jgi:hypothetical protein
MSARILAAAAVAVAAVAAARGPLTTGARPAPPPACTVAVTSVSPVVAQRGEEATISGSGFTCDGNAAAPPTVTVDGHALPLAAEAGDGALVIQATGAVGAVQVSVRDARCRDCPAPSVSNDDHLLLAAPVVATGTQLAPEGGRFSVTGSGLDLGGHLAGLGADACGEGLAVAGHDGTTVTLTAPAHFCQGAVTLHLSAFTDSERDATSAYPLPGGTLDTAMVAVGLSTAHAAPGERVTASGSGFGRGGAARLGGRPVPSTWFDRAVEITPVPDSVSGELELVRSDGRRLDAGHLSVDPPPPHPPAPPHTGPAPAGGRIPPTPPPSRSPVPPPATPSPRPALALRPAHTTAEPGHDVAFTVSLTSGGAPLVGTPVDLGLVRAPGGDASVTPALGLTDAEGRVSGLLHLSSQPGDHVVRARAGQYSDRVTVAACCSRARPAASTAPGDEEAQGGIPQRGRIVTALATCLVLFLSGFTLNLVTGAPRRGSRA